MGSVFPRAYFIAMLALSSNFALAQQPVKHWCQVWGNNANDGPAAYRMFADWVGAGFYRAETDKGEQLNDLFKDWSAPFCVTDDGYPRMGSIRKGFDNAFYFAKDWATSHAKVERLRALLPKSAPAATAEAEYWIQYAWNARGGGYASSVSPDGWKLFQERLEKAEDVLLESREYAAEAPIWYEQMIRVQTGLGRSAEERNGTFIEGVKKFKDYLPLYLDMAGWLVPRWGGSWELADQFVTWSSEYTKPFMGNVMYARLYWRLSGFASSEAKLFEETKASWPRMKSGFEDLMRQYPRSKWNQNNYAKFACIAGDKETYLAVRQRIGADVMTEAWSRSIELCDERFGYTN